MSSDTSKAQPGAVDSTFGPSAYSFATASRLASTSSQSSKMNLDRRAHGLRFVAADTEASYRRWRIEQNLPNGVVECKGVHFSGKVYATSGAGTH